LIFTAVGLGDGLTFFTVAHLLLGVAIPLGLMMAVALLNYSVELNCRFGKVWVRFLDVPYLFFGIVGLLRLIGSVAHPPSSPALLDFLALIAVTLALTVRVAKATIEIFFDDWVNAPPTAAP
jgi:hypothetical protein